MVMSAQGLLSGGPRFTFFGSRASPGGPERAEAQPTQLHTTRQSKTIASAFRFKFKGRMWFGYTTARSALLIEKIFESSRKSINRRTSPNTDNEKMRPQITDQGFYDCGGLGISV